jgi:hypothetical protein
MGVDRLLTPAKNASFSSAYPIFVPSPSWQNDHSYFKKSRLKKQFSKKGVFHTCGQLVGEDVREPSDER